MQIWCLSAVYTLVMQPQLVLPIRIGELSLLLCTLLFSLTQYHLITKQKADYAAIVIKGCHILNKSQLLRVGILKFWWLTITYWISTKEFPARHNYIILHYQGEIAIDQKCSNLRYKYTSAYEWRVPGSSPGWRLCFWPSDRGTLIM